MNLSVITVVWNNSAGLRRTLASLKPLSQLIGERKIHSFEHVIVDSSPELHAEVYPTIERQYPARIIVAPKNGVYDAMNIGIRSTKGDVAWFLNAGDTLSDPAALLEALELFADSPRSLLCASVIVVRGSDEMAHTCRNFHWGTFGKNKMCHQAILYPISILNEFGLYDTKYKIAADFKLHLQMYLAGVPLITFRKPFVKFELGGISSRLWPAFSEFSKIQWRCRRGLMNAVARQAFLVGEFFIILSARICRRLIGDSLFLRLKLTWMRRQKN